MFEDEGGEGLCLEDTSAGTCVGQEVELFGDVGVFGPFIVVVVVSFPLLLAGGMTEWTSRTHPSSAAPGSSPSVADFVSSLLSSSTDLGTCSTTPRSTSSVLTSGRSLGLYSDNRTKILRNRIIGFNLDLGVGCTPSSSSPPSTGLHPSSCFFCNWCSSLSYVLTRYHLAEYRFACSLPFCCILDNCRMRGAIDIGKGRGCWNGGIRPIGQLTIGVRDCLGQLAIQLTSYKSRAIVALGVQ